MGRASDGECAESYGRAAASPCGPSPAPTPSTASPPGGAVPSVACEMRRTSFVALAAAGVISGRTSASGRSYVLYWRRLIRSPGRLRTEGCGWNGRGVVSTVRGSARHGGGQGAAARRHREQQQLSTWCTGRGGEAAGGERAAGRWRRTLAREQSTRAAFHALRRSAGGEGKRLCRVRDAVAASGGPAAEDIGARPKHKGRLARAIGSIASRVYRCLRAQAEVVHERVLRRQQC
jgi:hypothetical protein